MAKIVTQQPPQVSSLRPSRIQPEHWKELVEGSGIDPEVILANFIMSFVTMPGERNDAWSWLNIYQDGNNVNYNGTIKAHVANKYANLDFGGWWIKGCEVTFNGSVYSTKDIDWGQFKPNRPREEEKEGRDGRIKINKIKYESPLGEPTRLMLLHPSPKAWDKWLTRYETKGTKKKKCPYKFKTDFKQFWKYVAQTNHPIVICEGAKKAMALISLGYAAISVPGIYGGYRNHETKIWDLRSLHKDFHAFLQQGREWVFCFDAETKPHVKNAVDTAISRTAELLKNANSKNKVRVIELPTSSSSVFGAKTGVDDFIVENGAEAFHALMNTAPTIYEWKAKATEALTPTPGKHLHLEKEDLVYSEEKGRYYLPADLFRKIPADEQLIGLKAPMGAGKTHAMKMLVGDSLKLGGVPILITHRIQLGQALASGLGVHYLSEIKDDIQRVQALNNGLGLCVDSLHYGSKLKFRASEWLRPTVIIDEFEQVLHHLIFSQTSVKHNRDLIIRNLGELLSNCVEAGFKIVLSDAHLTDTSIKFARNLIRESGGADIQPFLITADEFYLLGKGDRQCYFYNHTQPTAWLENLLLKIAGGEKVYVCTDGQKESSTYGTQALGKALKERFPDKKVLVIDSETTQDEKHPAFGIMDCINQEIVNWDIVITSPSVGTGISIDVEKHFNSVHGRFAGVVTPKQAVQQLSRVREDVPRYVWCATRGITEIAGGSISLKVIKAHEDYKYGALVRQLRASANFIADEESEVHMAGSCAAMDAYCEIALRTNAGTKGYRDFVKSALEKEGYVIIEPDDLDGDRKKELNDEIKENKDRLDEEDSRLKAEAEGCDKYVSHVETEVGDVKINMDIIARDDVQRLKDAKAVDKYQEAKLSLVSKYHIPLSEISQEFVAKDKKGMFNSLRFRYWFKEGRKFLQDRDWRVVDKALTHGRGFKPDLNRDTIGPRIEYLEKIGAEILFQREIIHNDDLELQKFVSELKEVNQIELKALTGISIGSTETTVQVVRKLYKLFGFSLTIIKHGEKGLNGKRNNVYALVDDYEAYSDTTIKRWLVFDEEMAANSPIRKICLEEGQRIEPPSPDLTAEAQIAEFLEWQKQQYLLEQAA